MDDTPDRDAVLLQRAFENARAGLVVGEPTGRVLWANRRARELFGEAVVGRMLPQVLADVARDAGHDWNRIIIEASATLPFTDASGREWAVSFSEIATAAGVRSGFVAELDDAGAVQQLKRQRAAFMGFLNHDLRSPVASLVALLDLCEMAPEKTPGDFMARVRRSATRTLQSAEDLMQLILVEEWAPEPLATVVSLGDAIQDAIDCCWDDAEENRVRIDLRPCPDDCAVAGDRNWLARMAAGLLRFALFDGAKQGTISCGLEHDGARVAFRLRYLRADPAGEDAARLLPHMGLLGTAGTGKLRADILPLALAKAIAEKHGGTLSAQNPDAGTRIFTVDLPLR